MIVTLTVLTDVYGREDKNGNRKLLVKDSEYQKQFNTSEILAEQFISKNGKPSKQFCLIKEGETYFKVKHTFNEIKHLTEPIKFNGFKYGK